MNCSQWLLLAIYTRSKMVIKVFFFIYFSQNENRTIRLHECVLSVLTYYVNLVKIILIYPLAIVDIVTFHSFTLLYVVDKIQAGDLHRRLQQWGAEGKPL